MTSESTRFLGQPRETKPTLGLDCWASGRGAASILGGGSHKLLFYQG